MAMGAAWKLRRVVENLANVLAIELLCAAQAVDYRAPLRPAKKVGEAHAIIRKLVKPLGQDRVFAGDIAALRGAIGDGSFDPLTGGIA
jgi:histidine ammonia-lyase